MRLSVEAALDFLCLFDHMEAEVFPAHYNVLPDVYAVEKRLGGLAAVGGDITERV